MTSTLFLKYLNKFSKFSDYNKLICLKKCRLHTSPSSYLFWERDRKGGYDTSPKEKPSTTELIRNGFKELKQEIKLWKNEVSEHFQSDPIMAFRPGETDVFWKFKNQESIDHWVTTSDKDHNEGKSECSLTLNPQGRGVFSGVLFKEPPKDGRIKRAGYCNMKSIRARKSFKREACLDWSLYNTLVLKVRGDGRSYLLNISTEGYFDVWWFDIYHFVLHTRGGPYWQTTRIPFSKFFLSSKGRVQDRQMPICLQKVTSFGISAGDKINGPFQLEIDYIGVEFDPSHREEFAYEMYKMKDNYMAAT